MDNYTCIAIDDDKLFLRKLSTFIVEIPWLTLLEVHNNPVQGATAVISKQPDILFLDMEMPHVGGDYLMDWVGPRFAAMTKKPRVIIVTSLEADQVGEIPNTSGYINKYKLMTPTDLDSALQEILA